MADGAENIDIEFDRALKNILLALFIFAIILAPNFLFIPSAPCLLLVFVTHRDGSCCRRRPKGEVKNH